MTWPAATFVLVPVLAVTHAWVNRRQAVPYMDEVFHVPQAAAFCNELYSRRFPAYSPHISTPPGLYVLPALLSPVFGCGVPVLRAFSLAAVFATFLLLANVAQLCGADSAQAWRVALALATHPPLLFSAALFYTDAPAAALLALCWLLALRNRSCAAAVAGIGAVFVRQTSVVWHAFFVLHALALSWRDGASSNILFRQTLPHLASALLYVALFIANDYSLAVGERNSHTLMLHAAQLPFFAAYQAFFASFALLSVVPFALRSAIRRPLFTTAIFIFAVLVAAACVAHTGSYVHPYSLADNRHYVFYIYSKILRRGALVRYALVPLYAVALLLPLVPQPARRRNNVAKEKQQDWLPSSFARLLRGVDGDVVLDISFQLIALGVVAVSVVTSPLLEPRYFIPGFLVSMMLFLTRKNARFGNRECFAFTFANLAIYFTLIFVFAERPFERAPDPHMPHDRSPGRFML